MHRYQDADGEESGKTLGYYRYGKCAAEGWNVMDRSKRKEKSPTMPATLDDGKSTRRINVAEVPVHVCMRVHP